MPADRAFFDTNILVYAFSIEHGAQQVIAFSLLSDGGTVGVQTLNEYANVLTGKLKKSWHDAIVFLDAVQGMCSQPIPVTLSVHQRGLDIAGKTGYHIYDSMMLAAALEAECTIFYTEDLHDGQVIEGLTIRNPFRKHRVH
jgi:predicted nucleic acid-binding protein